MAKSDNTKALEAIAEKLVGVSVTELPAVGVSDNGKVLMVVNGAWAAAELPADASAETTSAATETVSGT